MVPAVSVEELRPEKRAFAGRVAQDCAFTLVERVSPEGSVADGAWRAPEDRPVRAVGAHRGFRSIEAPAHAPPARELAGLAEVFCGAGQRRNPRRRRTRQDNLQQLRR